MTPDPDREARAAFRLCNDPSYSPLDCSADVMFAELMWVLGWEAAWNARPAAPLQVTDEAVARAWSAINGVTESYITFAEMRAALTAALPHMRPDAGDKPLSAEDSD